MGNFDFAKEMENIRNFIQSEQYRQVGVNIGLILEKCLKYLYADIRKNATQDTIELIDSKRKEIGIKNIKNSMLGQLITLYKKAKLFRVAEKILETQISTANCMNLYRLRDIRNGCAHGEYTPTLKEIEFYYFSLKLLLQEIGYISDGLPGEFSENFFLKSSDNELIKCRICEKMIKKSHIFCPFCRNPSRKLCVKCGEEVDDDWDGCTKCGASIKQPSEKETDFLKHVSIAIHLAASQKRRCPICDAEPCIDETEYDDNSGEWIDFYCPSCSCPDEIAKLQKAGRLEDPCAEKFISYYNYIQKANLLDFYPAVVR
jgi:hypothetical protein